MIRKLNCSEIEKTERDVKVLQFGEGNFLRAFVDWQIDVANRKGVTNIGVAICQPIIDPEHKLLRMIEMLREQDCMYHVYLEGIEEMSPVKRVDLVQSVMDCFNPYVEHDLYMKYALSPSLRIVVSNTTEAGIRYVEGDDIHAKPPKSFPVKVTKLLYDRYKYFSGDETKGLIFLCCELIEDNGSTLRNYVLEHARYNNLESDFVRWVKNCCIFCDTLVDRIVSGFPFESIEAVKSEIGYEDNLVVKGEYYHLWAIGGKDYEIVKREFPLDKAGLHVLYMSSIKQFRDKKVRILNGAHTGMVSIALQMGCETVMDAFAKPEIEAFVKGMIAQEVLPVIDEDQAELESFSKSILERFYNPYIKHLLKSISLNSLSKWEARNYPTVKDNWEKRNMLARYECFSFAALLTLYSGKSDFVPNDIIEHVKYIQKRWAEGSTLWLVESLVTESGIFTVDFSEIPDFTSTVANYIELIEEKGMLGALREFLFNADPNN